MTRFQLRRLALQATRRPELLPVLQDALLGSSAYGVAFADAIETAHRQARLAETGGFQSSWRPPGVTSVAVVFQPGVPPPFTFDVYGLEAADFDATRPHSIARFLANRGRILVYTVPVPAISIPERRCR